MAGLDPKVSQASLLALLALIALGPGDAMAHGDPPEAKAATPTVTAAPIYLPYYDERSWSLVRGSIISTVRTAHCMIFSSLTHHFLPLLQAMQPSNSVNAVIRIHPLAEPHIPSSARHKRLRPATCLLSFPLSLWKAPTRSNFTER